MTPAYIFFWLTLNLSSSLFPPLRWSTFEARCSVIRAWSWAPKDCKLTANILFILSVGPLADIRSSWRVCQPTKAHSPFSLFFSPFFFRLPLEVCRSNPKRLQ
ncbi:hypothetical protein VTK73DRAFT_1922 [Phialemonium thermophilum]|uniref:Secreted protein n=1 Tax=Phialemonium thermophilum TaxID=223376 RepID=A0ABR3Y2Q1_9PEZI